MGPLGPTRLALYRTAEEKRELEVRNGAIQFLAVLHLISEWKPESKLTPAIVLELQRLAINQIYSCAGFLRNTAVRIAGVSHVPPCHGDVERLVGEMCDYVNNHWDAPALHLASYLMWRVNWIHPFLWWKRTNCQSARISRSLRQTRVPATGHKDNPRTYRRGSATLLPSPPKRR
jgi:fido (protein-threonine AMPylation protein)